MGAYLKIEIPGQVPEWKPLEGSVFRIGSSEESDIIIDHGTVSSTHAMLRKTEQGWRIFDLGGRNGIRVNGEKLSEVLMSSGIQVHAGQVILEIDEQEEDTDLSENTEGIGIRATESSFLAVCRENFFDRVESVDSSMKMSEEELKDLLRSVLEETCQKENREFLRPDKFAKIEKTLSEELLGLGPLEDLLKDDSVTEIMVLGTRPIYVERNGKLVRTSIAFYSDRALLHVMDKIVAPLGRRIDESSPAVDARLPDGSRVHAIIPPLSVRGPCLTIRKFKPIPLTMKTLTSNGTITEAAAKFLEECVKLRCNIMVSGGTGSGKTTLLNILASCIDPSERIVTIEDAAELQLPQDHVVPLEARPKNIEGKGEVTIRELLRNALRMRPDRIIVGECRGPEALDMLQAMNTGHDGGMATLHANNPRDAVARLETMVLTAGADLPLRAVREQISRAVHLIVQIERNKDGKRCISAISEVCGVDGDTVLLQSIFETSSDGELRPSGLIPTFLDGFKKAAFTEFLI